jgi:3-deoxy-7-phosphoheptulonate synthase
MNLDSYPAAQQPPWPNRAELAAVCRDLASGPVLVTPPECDGLRDKLAEVARGEALMLQGGDCAETFAGATQRAVDAKLQLLLQMATVLTIGCALPVVKVGRIAGQFAKPRSEPGETRDGITLPAYRGEAVNSLEFTERARTPDPERLRLAYQASQSLQELIRGFAAHSDVVPGVIRAWGQDFAGSAAGAVEPWCDGLLTRIDKILELIESFRVSRETFGSREFFVSHEALLLDYEGALTRPDPRTGRLYAGSAHMVWIGERTRQPDGAHVEFASRIANPVGVKLGPTANSDDALALIDRLDPAGEPGRLTFITRMGADKVRDLLPPLVEKVTASGAQVGWICDPMHGNTFRTPGGYKTRRVEDVLAEVRGFFEVHQALGTHPGGIQLEFTGEDVTECIGSGVGADDLGDRYESACDPRLNRVQCRDLIYHIAAISRSRQRSIEVTRAS